MISYALDTNAVIAVLAGQSTKVQARLFSCGASAVSLPAVVVHELYFGSFRSQRIEHNLAMLRRLAGDMSVLDFDSEDARVSAEVRATLAARGTPIGPYDVLIAGQAKARGLTVVTNNVREFSRVDGLKIEDWTR